MTNLIPRRSATTTLLSSGTNHAWKSRKHRPNSRSQVPLQERARTTSISRRVLSRSRLLHAPRRTRLSSRFATDPEILLGAGTIEAGFIDVPERETHVFFVFGLFLCLGSTFIFGRIGGKCFCLFGRGVLACFF